MTVSTSRASYEDCYDILDRALASPIGIRISAEGKGPAHHLCTRLNYARTLSRQEAREINDIGAPGYGVSAYDTLLIRQPRVEDGVWWIYIEPRTVNGKIEELSKNDKVPPISHQAEKVISFKAVDFKRRRFT